MLILSRRAGDSVFVGEITVEVLSIHAGRVKLGFQGPREVPIARAELDMAAAARQSPAATTEEAAA